MKRFALLLASTTLFAAPAFAADVTYEEPPAPEAFVEAPAYGWSGFYVGGQAGVGFGGDDGDVSVSGAFPNDIVTRGDNGDASFTGGGQVGYDYQMGNFIVGAVADFNYIDRDAETSVTLADPTADGATFGSKTDVKAFGTLRAKAGVANERVAVYATGGLAYADVDTKSRGPGTFTSVAGTGYDVSTKSDSDKLGYSVGAGVDVLATENVSFGLEYLYTDVGESKTRTEFNAVGAAAAGDPASFSTRSKTDVDFHTVMAKAAYRFH